MSEPLMQSLFTSNRRRAEIGMLENLTRTMAAISRAQGMVELSPDGRCLTANDTFLGHLGMRREDVCGHPYHAVLVEADGAAYR
jgi:PAS domain-containing protein